MICVDASLAAKWVLREGDSELALALYRNSNPDGLVAPPLMPSEVTNAIWKRVTRGGMPLSDAQSALTAFFTFDVEIAVPAELHRRALDLAAQFGQPAVYDMHYVALAQIAGCDLWTADERLVNTVAGRLPFVRSLADFRI
jgi:predicted nucleic acid-binding protein